MRKRIKEIVSAVTIGVALLVAGYGYSQTQFQEMFDILFRPQNPQIRVSGKASVRNLAGTGAGALASARPAIVTDAATMTLGITDCGAVVVANRTTSTQTFTLPDTGNIGCMITFIAGHADGEILVNAAGKSQTCVITTFVAVGTDADTGIVTDSSCETGLKNTGGTNAIGDSMTLVSDGARWLGVGITSGIWATQ